MIYLFSGLGADKRVFKNLKILEKFPHKFIEWINPEDHDLNGYAELFIEQIDQDEEIILIGVSFGGMIVTEISEMIGVKKSILISSSRNSLEIPKIYRLAGKGKLIEIMPNRLLTKSNWMTNWFFGVKKPEDRQLLKKILEDTDTRFLKWALRSIINWKRRDNRVKLIQIHGDSDRILSWKNINEARLIKGGGHLMILDKSEEIDKILREELK